MISAHTQFATIVSAIPFDAMAALSKYHVIYVVAKTLANVTAPRLLINLMIFCHR
jgi:hypothetical protein